MLTNRSAVWISPRDIGWCDPLPTDCRQVVLGRPTGDRAPLSNVDRQIVLMRFREQLAHGWHADTLQGVAHGGLEQFGGVTGEYDADVGTNIQRPMTAR